MGRQIIKHPNGGYNVWSTIVDNWLFEGSITARQYIAFRRKEAADEAEMGVKDIVSKLEAGQKPYYQFTMTYEEAEETRKRQHSQEEPHANNPKT